MVLEMPVPRAMSLLISFFAWTTAGLTVALSISRSRPDVLPLTSKLRLKLSPLAAEELSRLTCSRMASSFGLFAAVVTRSPFCSSLPVSGTALIPSCAMPDSQDSSATAAT